MSNKKELLQQQYSLLLKGRKALDSQLDVNKNRFDAMCREIHRLENEISVYEQNMLFIEAKLKKETKTKPITIPKVIPFEKELPKTIPEEPEILTTKDIKDNEPECIFESLYIPSSEISEPTEKKTFFQEDNTESAKVIDFDNMAEFKPEIDKVASVGWLVWVKTEQEFEGGIIKLQKKQLKLKTSDGILNIPYYMIQDWKRLDL